MKKIWGWLVQPTRLSHWFLICSLFGMVISVSLIDRWTMGMRPFEPLPTVWTLNWALDNSGLERPYSQRGSPEVEVADGWEPWWREGSGYHRPEFKPMEEPDRIYEGKTSQKTFTVYAKHFGGLYQIVEGLKEGNWYTFSCQLQMKSSGGKSFGAVGVNPWGDAWPEHWTTNWGRAAYNTFDKWMEVEVVFQAWSPKAALFTMGEGEWAVSWQDWYWDACVLRSSTAPEPVPTPTPVPTEPPIPLDCPSLEDIQQMFHEELRAIEVEVDVK